MAGRSSTSPSRLQHWLLVASLVLNVLLIGGIAAGLVARHGAPFFDGHDRRRMMGLPSPHKIRDVLPDSAEPAIDAAFSGHRQEMRTSIDALIEARRQVAAVMRAEPFDRAALEDALAKLRDREAAVARGAQAAIGDLAAGLDDESRARLAELIQISRGHGRGPEH